MLAALVVLKGLTLADLSARLAVAATDAYYAKHAEMAARFEQTYENTVVGTTSKASGRVYVKRPGKMRWDYEKPERSQFVTDGKTLWVWERAQKQVLVKSLAGEVLPIAVAFLFGKGSLAADFTAARGTACGLKKDVICVKLTPRQPSASVKTLWLAIDAKDSRVREARLLEASGNVNTFRFSKAQATVPSGTAFTLDPKKLPAGTRVVKP